MHLPTPNQLSTRASLVGVQSFLQVHAAPQLFEFGLPLFQRGLHLAHERLDGPVELLRVLLGHLQNLINLPPPKRF